MNIIHAGIYSFFTSDLKKLRHFCGPLKVPWALGTVSTVLTE